MVCVLNDHFIYAFLLNHQSLICMTNFTIIFVRCNKMKGYSVSPSGAEEETAILSPTVPEVQAQYSGQFGFRHL